MSERKAMIDKTDPDISVSAQSKLLGISRSGLYQVALWGGGREPGDPQAPG